MDYKLLKGHGVATGTDNYVVAKLSVTYLSLEDGLYYVDIPASNTGASDLKIDDFAPYEILSATGAALTGGELATRTHQFYYKKSTNKFHLLDSVDTTVVAHALGGADHTPDTLANLNSKITDATLDDASSPRTPVAHTHDAADIDSGTLDNARVAESNVTQHQAAIDHDQLANYDIAQHRIINDVGASTTEMWSSSKIDTELSAIESGVKIKNDVVTSTCGLGNITLSGEQVLNGVTTSASRVLVPDQTDKSENGIWVTGTPWTRATDYDGNPEGEVGNGDTIYVNSDAHMLPELSNLREQGLSFLKENNYLK